MQNISKNVAKFAPYLTRKITKIRKSDVENVDRFTNEMNVFFFFLENMYKIIFLLSRMTFVFDISNRLNPRNQTGLRASKR